MTMAKPEPRLSRRLCAAWVSFETKSGFSCAPATPTTCTSWSSEARGIFLRAAPVDVSAIVRELLLDRMRTTVLTSATLTVDGTFEYIRKRLGIKNAAEICLPSEFDFARQALMYLPPRMPDPRSTDFPIAAGREVIEILKRTHGRAFVLFTSYATMRAVQAIAEMALDYPILAQGTAPRSQLLKQFRETPHAVLFATSSFWQGVDVVGRSAELRDHRQAAVCLAFGPGHGSPHRGDPRARRRSVRRIPGAACHPGPAAGARSPHPSPAATVACWLSSIRGCARRATDGGLSRRCRPLRSSRISGLIERFSAIETDGIETR